MHLSLLILVFTATAVPMGACLPFAVDKRPNKDTGAHDQHLISTSMSKVDGVHNICCCYGGVGSWAVSEWLVYHFLAIVVARLILVLRVVRLFFFLVCLYTHIYLGAFFFRPLAPTERAREPSATTLLVHFALDKTCVARVLLFMLGRPGRQRLLCEYSLED